MCEAFGVSARLTGCQTGGSLLAAVQGSRLAIEAGTRVRARRKGLLDVVDVFGGQYHDAGKISGLWWNIQTMVVP